MAGHRSIDAIMRPALPRAIGAALLILYLPLYIAMAVTIAGALADAPVWAALLYYAAAGMIWIIPLYPLFKWMRAR